MNEFLIKQYLNNLTYKDINDFAKQHGITLKAKETEIIYEKIKNNWRTILYGNPKDILADLKTKLSNEAYNKAEELYIHFKDKLTNHL